MATQHVLQICEEKSDSFWLVTEELLLQCLEEPDLAKREALLRQGIVPTEIHSTSKVVFVLVLNGHEDEESWEELAEHERLEV